MNRIRLFFLCAIVGFFAGCSGNSSTLTPQPTPSAKPTASASSTPTPSPSPTPSRTPTPSPTPTSTPTASPTPTQSPVGTSAAYYFCVGIDGLTPAEISNPANPFPIPHIASPCVFINSGVPNEALAVSNQNIGFGQIGEESVTCNGPCTLFPTAPKSLPVTVQIVSIPSNAPQLTGITFNIEANAAHALGYQGLFLPCAVIPPANPYTYSGGGETYTITQSVSESERGTCGIDIYDQYGDYVYIELQAQD